jgi:hypothetical protein
MFQLPASDGVPPMNDLIDAIDTTLDAMLVTLGNMVLKLSSPHITRTSEEHAALARSVSQFSSCARHSSDPRVRELASKLEGTRHPRLRLVANR